MSPDPERCAEAREWLVRAQHDLLAAQALLGTRPTLSDVAVYHCQQAAEKALKAFLFWHDTPFRKTHDLEELGVQCVALDASLDSLLDKISTLTPYALAVQISGSRCRTGTEPGRGGGPACRRGPQGRGPAAALRGQPGIYGTNLRRLMS